MIRRIITINQETCNGCGACATACHEGAIAIVAGKAVLTREDYCDGLGDCLPTCPTGAITFEEREALAYDEAAVKASQAERQKQACRCPGEMAKNVASSVIETAAVTMASQLRQWPVQLKLVPVTAAYFEKCDLLIAADCTAYAYGAFHTAFIRGRVTLIGCPKLDAMDYSEKLAQIFQQNSIKSITLTRMEVPCCGGMVTAVQRALAVSGKDIPLHIVTIAADGRILSE